MVTRPRIKNGGHRKRKGNNLGKCEEVDREFLRAMCPDDQLYVLVGAESEHESEHEMAPWEKIESVLSQLPPIGQYSAECRLQTRCKAQA